MSRYIPSNKGKAIFGVLAIVAANVGFVMSATGVSYAAMDSMMQNYSSSSMSMN